MKWILKFKRKAAPEGGGCVCITIRCPEEALQGEKEASCMEQEKEQRGAVDLRRRGPAPLEGGQA